MSSNLPNYNRRTCFLKKFFDSENNPQKKVSFNICVRDSDPLGTRPAQRGLVLGGERQALAQPIAPRI